MPTVVYAKKPGPKLLVIPAESRAAVFVERNILIHPGNRCCLVHFNNGAIPSDAIQQIPTTENAFINRRIITELLQQLRSLCQKNEKRCLNFDDK